MKRLGLLMLGGAKRVSIAQMFRLAGRRLGYEVEFYSYELSKRVPIASEAKIILGKRWGDLGVVADIQRVIRENSIDIVIPFVDGAIAVASRLSGVFAPVSDEELCLETYDKLLADKLFREHSIPVPRSYQPSEIRNPSNLPLIAKPALGSASKGIKIMRTIEDVPPMEQLENHLIQEYLGDYKEVTVDCYVGRDATVLAVVPRLRVEVVGGEVVRTRTIVSAPIVELSERVLTTLKFRGTVTLQYLVKGEDIRLMEINARLGGGVVCSVHAGADIPELIIREWAKLDVSRTDYEPNVEIARYFAEVVFRDVKEGADI